MAKRLIVRATCHKKSEKRTGKKAYIARLKPGLVGSVERDFSYTRAAWRSAGSGRKKNITFLKMDAAPGDVFESRVVKWDGDADTVRTYWFAIDKARRIVPLTRDEAFASVHMPRIEAAPPAEPVPALRQAERMWTDDIDLIEADEPELIG